MHNNVLKVLRAIQVYFPFLQDYKFRVKRSVRQWVHQPHEDDFKALSYFRCSSTNLFLDVGANRGEAIQSILMMRPDASVIAFEPNHYLTEKIRKVYKNDPRVEIRDFGLGSADGSFRLFVPFYNNFMFDGLASFKERRARNWLVNRMYGFNSKKLEVKKVVCQVKRLDDLDLAPCFIKIDVQGFEYEVLRGAANTLSKCKPVVLMETPAAEELDFLSSLGYEAFCHRKSRLYPGTAGQNVFFLHPESPVAVSKERISRYVDQPPRPDRKTQVHG